MNVREYVIATTGHHQRIKSPDEIHDYYEKRTSQNSWSTCTWGSIDESSYLLFFFASHLVYTTVAWVTSWWVKFVDEVWSTIFNWNCDYIFATSRTITKADLPFYFTIFHCRLSISQPTWPVCITSVCWHTRCWHFCTSSPHKTIPSLRELAVTQLWTVNCYVTYLSITITQVFYNGSSDVL